LHAIGTDANSDRRALARSQFPDVAMQEIEFPIVVTQHGSPWALGVLYAGVQNELTIFVNSLEAASKGQRGWRKVCDPADKITDFAFRGDDIYLVTYKDAPRYRLLHVRADSADVAGAREVMPQGATVIQNVYTARDAIYVKELDGGIGRLTRLGSDGKSERIALPFDGTIGTVYANPGVDGLWCQLENWVRPGTIFRVAASGAVTDAKLSAPPPIDVTPYDSTRVFATAKDGTKVPVSVVFRKDIKRDGTAPTLIDAYGSYGYSYDPYFAPSFIAWLDAGGIWATAHVRGGGEYGREWHEGGRLLTKPNTWGDLIAAAEALTAEKWTSTGKLAIRGVSAGGITVGRALTDRPDLFAAVISQVGSSNTLREEFAQNGPPNVPEFGSIATEDGFRGLYAMDSTVHVKDGVRYPAVMLTTGMTDPRVDPWEAAKMAAHLQKATASGKPVLLRVDFQAGHGIGSTRAQSDAELSDIFAFILWQAGAEGFQPA
jgi:prolyl oligopeptidase